MNIIENDELRGRLFCAFPKGFVNRQLEFIAHPARNSYFGLKGVETEEDLNAKILEWLSRAAVKGGSRQSQQYHLDGINQALGTFFSKTEMEDIYQHLGNSVNHEKTLRFIRSGYSMKVLEEPQ